MDRRIPVLIGKNIVRAMRSQYRYVLADEGVAYGPLTDKCGTGGAWEHEPGAD